MTSRFLPAFLPQVINAQILPERTISMSLKIGPLNLIVFHDISTQKFRGVLATGVRFNSDSNLPNAWYKILKEFMEAPTCKNP